MNIRHTIALSVLFASLCGASPCVAQVDSLVFNTEDAHIAPTEKNELRFNLQALAFFKDNEFNSKDVVKGYTLPGMWISPSISYQPLHNLRVEVGAHMLHYWGADRYPTTNIGDLTHNNDDKTTKAFHCVPLFRANLQLSNKVNIVLGSIYGKAFHQLTEPLYNSEKCLTADPETGVQLIWNNHWLHFDTWVDWQKFIYKRDNKQEEFTYGLSARLLANPKTKATQVYFPLQVLMHHIGGEINTEAQERSIKTWLNAATGVGINIPLNTRIPTSINSEVTAHYYSQQKGTALPYKNGTGIFAKVQAKVWNFCATASYWYSNKFISIYGNPLFNAIGNTDEVNLMSKPRMFILQAEYAQQIGHGFSWGVSIAYDIHNQKSIYHTETSTWDKGKATSDLGAGIYLRLNPSFLIKKFKTEQTH